MCAFIIIIIFFKVCGKFKTNQIIEAGDVKNHEQVLLPVHPSLWMEGQVECIELWDAQVHALSSR